MKHLTQWRELGWGEETIKTHRKSLEVPGTEWNDSINFFTSAGFILVYWTVDSSFIQIHERLAELNKSSFRSISFAVSGGINHGFLGNSKSSNHFLLVSFWKFGILERNNSDLLHSSVQLLALIISWVIVEDSVGSKDNRFD